MGESFPLFQSVLTSTPFSGTLADTSTPSPAGDMPQVAPSAPMPPPQAPPPLPTVPQPTEAPGDAGNRERASKIASDRALIQNQLQQLANMQWRSSSKWTRAHNLALYGKDIEPADMLYKRQAAMEHLLSIDANLAEQERLANAPSPFEQAYQEAQGKEAVRLEGVTDRLRRVSDINVTLKEMQLPEIPPDRANEWAQNPTAKLTGSAEGAMDPIKLIEAAQRIGQNITPDAIQHLPPSIQGPAYDAMKAKQIEDKAKAAREAAGADKPMTSVQLFNMGQSLYNDVIATIPPTGTKKIPGKNPFTGAPDSKFDQEVPTHSEEDAKKARVQVTLVLPEILKKFPTYVEKGSAAPPVVEDTPPAAPSPVQKDLTPEQKRAALKAKLAQAP